MVSVIVVTVHKGEGELVRDRMLIRSLESG